MGSRKFESETWQKSSLCDSSDNCVEVSLKDGCVLVRDSKNPALAPLYFTLREWAQFIGGAVRGEFDANRLAATGAVGRAPQSSGEGVG